jgi:ligand-binding sensor domain-containing protein/signal transduction histidine kinase
MISNLTKSGYDHPGISFINLETILFLILFLVNLSSVYSQSNTIRFQHLGQDDGLSQNTQFCVFQDSKGFIWVGTEDGLNKYDGYKFTSFRTEWHNPNSLSENHVYSITEDHEGFLWIGTDNGLNKFDSKKNIFIKYTYNKDDPNSLQSNKIFVVFEDKQKTLWIGTDNGLYKYNREADSFNGYLQQPDDAPGSDGNLISSITESKNGKLWIGTNGNGLYSFSREDGNFTRYKNDPDDPGSLYSNNILTVCEDNDGILWIGTYDAGLISFNQAANRFTRFNHDQNNPYKINDDWISCVYEDRAGNLWIGTNSSGFYLYNRKENRFNSYQKKSNHPYELSGNNIRCFYEDRSDVIWIGMYASDLNKTSFRSNNFQHYYVQTDNPNSLNNNMIRSFYIDHYKNLWVGTDGGGINVFDSERERNTIFEFEPGNDKSIRNNRIFSIKEDKYGRIWIGTFGGGLNLFDPLSKTFKHFLYDPSDSQSISDDNVRTIFTDGGNYLWIGTSGGGLNRLNLITNKFQHYNNEPDNKKSLNDDRIYSILKDKNSKYLWIGTFGGGLDKFDPKTETFTHYTVNPNINNCLPNNYIIALYQDEKGILWIGTNGGGLTRFDPIKEIFKSYTTREGLIHNAIYGILPDDDGNLWISTTGGISKFDTEREFFKNYNMSDGLQNNEFNGGSFYKSSDGLLYFGGINGFNSFNPDKIVVNQKIPKIVISDFQLFNKSVRVSSDDSTPLVKSITETKVITLSYSENVFSFEYAALDFTSPEKNEYAYIMEGLDNVWNHVGNRRFVTYTGLQPGNYTFRVTGSNNDGIWNQTGTSLKIIITPPFWQTIWFRLLMTVAVLVIIWSLYKYRVKKIEAQNEILETQVQERTRELIEANATKDKFFSIISHDLRSPFQGLLALSDFLASNIDDYDKDDIRDMATDLNKSSNILFDLLNNLLEWSRIQTQNLKTESEELNLSETVARVIKLLSINAYDKKILLTSDIDVELIVLADPNMINSVIQNLIANAIKFTNEGGEIRITAVKKNDFTEVSVSDSGLGMGEDTIKKLFRIDTKITTPGTKNERGTGLGLILCKELLEKNGGCIRVESEVGKGTTFYFTVRNAAAYEKVSLLI